MADSKVSALDTLVSVDRATDLLYVVDASGPTSNKMTINGALGISGGNPVSTSDPQTLTNKTLTSPAITVADNALTIQDNSDTTKQLQFQASGITTGTTRTLTVPDANTTIVGTDTTQTLTNKTFTSPTINTATIVNPTITADSISEYTAANGVNIDGMNIKDGAVGANGVVTASITDSAVTPAKLQSGTGSGWTWQNWTPTLTNLSGGTLNYAKYIQVGKTVIARFKYTLAGAGVAGGVTFTLPVNAAGTYAADSESFLSTVSLIDLGNSFRSGVVLYATATTATIRYENSSSEYVSLSSTAPFTWGVNDFIQLHMMYEAA